MPKIRVLVADDAVVVRRLVSDVLSGDPMLEVVGTAPNGRLALAKIPQVNPDVVILDVEMPEMDGLETLAALRKQWPKLPVIMFSTLAQRGAAATLEALSLGANDYVTKPANVGSALEARHCLASEMIPKIKAACGIRLTSVSVERRWEAFPTGTAALSAPLRPAAPRAPSRLDVVAIGVSTGGPNALSEVFAQLPATFPVPILIVQHMPPVFTRLLAERLGSKSPLAVSEAAGGERLEPGRAFLAPGNFHLTVERDAAAVRLRLNQDPPENSCRPAADVLFRSVAAVYGPGALGVVLTGMGYDGLRGSEAIREAGGQVLAQDEATSVVWGMPGFVTRAGLADQVVPLGGVAAEILRRVRKGRPFSGPAAVGGGDASK